MKRKLQICFYSYSLTAFDNSLNIFNVLIVFFPLQCDADNSSSTRKLPKRKDISEKPVSGRK